MYLLCYSTSSLSRKPVITYTKLTFYSEYFVIQNFPRKHIFAIIILRLITGRKKPAHLTLKSGPGQID